MHDTEKQHRLWLLVAASAPLAHSAGCGWFPAILTAVGVLPLLLLPKSWDAMPRLLSWLQVLWLGAVTGMLLRHSAVYWPSGRSLTVPLTLLILAAITGVQAAPRIGAVLAFCVVLLMLPVGISGAAHLEPMWLKQTTAPCSAVLLVGLLFPVLPAAGKGRPLRWGAGSGALAITLALLIQGTISPQVAAAVPDPFYQTARTLGYLEPVAAVAMTLGWYAMAIYLLHSAEQIAAGGGMGEKTATVLSAGTAAAVILLKEQPGDHICMILSILLWVFAPFWNKIKKTKKHEK